ncbi:MAG: hypothetical protein U1E99_01820 [Agitococcus sp.]
MDKINFFTNSVKKRSFGVSSVFSKQAKIPRADMEKIWNGIAEARSDSAWMRKTIAKYQK